jgi:hypothetical protein
MVERYETVLVVGGEGEKCRQVAEGYGFRDVITPGDIIKDNEATTPFRKLTTEEIANSRKRDYGKTKIEAILYVLPRRTPTSTPTSLSKPSYHHLLYTDFRQVFSLIVVTGLAISKSYSTLLCQREAISAPCLKLLMKAHPSTSLTTILSGLQPMTTFVLVWALCER